MLGPSGTVGIQASDNNGDVQERFSYDAYGKAATMSTSYVVNAGSGAEWEYLVSGRRLDSETALNYYRNRQLDVHTARFLSRDSVGSLEQMRNSYAYVQGRPISAQDPLGLFPIKIIFGAFIPRNLGQKIVDAPLSDVRWAPEPNGLPGVEYYFATDDRSKAGVPGSSRVSSKATIESNDIGRLRQRMRGQRIFEAQAQPTHRLKASGSPLTYVEDSLESKTAKVVQGEHVKDLGPECSCVYHEAHASYPHLVLNVAPNVAYAFTICFTRTAKRQKVDASIRGKHKYFPKYEWVVDGSLEYESTPWGKGPGLLNLTYETSFSDSTVVSPVDPPKS
jgi:RHS repeat-associated protein